MSKLTTYRKKRDFRRTPEPRGGGKKRSAKAPMFVVQKHDASHLHYDFRLELDGTLKSWAVPKGPSVDPKARRLAVHVEDHPLEYGNFEGTIPAHEYGGGTVMLWDRGTWEPEGDPRKSYRNGRLKFTLDGQKLRGRWSLVRMGGRAGDDGKNWLLIKDDDEFASAKAGQDPLRQQTESVSTGRSMEEIRDAGGPAGDATAGAKASSSKRGGRKTAHGGTTATNKPAKRIKTVERPGGDESDEAIALYRLAQVPGARKARTPATFQPQLATLSRDVPEDDGWLHEIKFDGYRILATRRGRKWRLITRRGHDWTHRFPAIAAELEHVPLDEGILDGEVVVLKESGVSDFQALQNALRRDQRARMHYYVFDVPHCNGYDLTRVGQLDRKRVLRGLLSSADERRTSHIHFSDHTRGQGPALLARACRMGLEGMIAKRVDAAYEQKRTQSWRKLRCGNRQEFVIVGYTEPRGARRGLGALLVGVHENGALRYSGKVGTGFDEQTLAALHETLSRRETAESPLKDAPPEARRGVHWVRPELVAEVEFTEWTEDARLRHPVFRGLREDKPPEQVRRERPSQDDAGPRKRSERAAQRRPASRSAGRAGSGSEQVNVEGVRLTHPEKILYPDQKVTKQALAEYYVQVAEWILPHVVDRPLSLVRCPAGRAGKCFYQKHVSDAMGAQIHSVTIEEKQGQGEYVYIRDLAGLIALVQVSVLEIHPWGSRVDRYDRPDRIVFDLDPDASMPFADTVAAARQVRQRLSAVELESFAKTTGGKGLHVVVPLVRRNTWDEVRTFAEATARGLVASDPDRYVANMRKEKRRKKIFIDYLRNAQGATSVAPYSTRARAGAPVATPVHWDELDGVTPDGYTISNVVQRLARRKRDPWPGFDDVRQSLTRAMLRETR